MQPNASYNLTSILYLTDEELFAHSSLQNCFN
uniref:Uncharacterized protein n=1 Tax=Anguilla anguilla TaxID=7936 RepID=A0A0E9WE76_ANGAN